MNGAIIDVSIEELPWVIPEPINIPIMELIIVDISVIEALPLERLNIGSCEISNPPLWINVVKFIRSFKLIEVEFGIVNPTRS